MKTDWVLKTAAFLNCPPDISLFPYNIKEKGEYLIRLAMERMSLPDPSNLHKIEKVASGLDIPPFVEKFQPDCFRKHPVLTHPLSGQEFQITLPKEFTPDDDPKYQRHIETVLKNIKREVDGNPRKLFFALWRLFPERLAKSDLKGLGHLWKVLPADPRIPSHTIWEHASVASAIAGAWPEPAILVFTIASAQELVAAARRTQDAWMGSFVLSYLSWKAIKVVAEACGPDVIVFPSLHGQPLVDLWLSKELGPTLVTKPDEESLKIGNIPNLFTAIVPKDQAKGLAETAENAVMQSWKEIANTVKIKIENAINEDWRKDISSWRKIWDRQAEAFIEGMGIFWVICPWGQDYEEVIKASKKEDSALDPKPFEVFISNLKECHQPNIGMVYHLLSMFAGKGLTSRKNLRHFNQIYEPGHKCSLCGKWEALHPDFTNLTDVDKVTQYIKNEEIRKNPDVEQNHYRWLSAFWEALSELDREVGGVKLKGRIRKGERLCSACLTRRMALEAFFLEDLGISDWHIFPSTAGIATASYRGRILEALKKNGEIAKALSDYVQSVTKFIKDNHLPAPAASPAYLKKLADGIADGNGFLEIDGDWLYENSFDLMTLEQSYKLKNTAEIEKCKEAVKLLNKIAGDLGLGEPPRYYAILAMDADQMGDWLTSMKAPWYKWLFHPEIRNQLEDYNPIPYGYKRPLGPSLQLALSDSLKNFSLSLARKIVEEDHPGKLIYSGGDDLMAFLPLDHLFSVMEELYLGFRGKTNGYQTTETGLLRLMGGVRKEIGIPDHSGMTVSMGIIIAHHAFPLYQAMQEVQHVLKNRAKKLLGRNAFAIRLLKRSGEYIETGCRFVSEEDAETPDILDKMDKILIHLREGTLSGRLAYQMAENLWAKSSENERDHGLILEEARRQELARIARRHASKGFEDKVETDILSLYDAIVRSNSKIGASTEGSNQVKRLDPWQTMEDLLLTLRFVAGKGD